jgi:hypothetical protein
MDIKVQCPTCETTYRLPSPPQRKASAPCKNCGSNITVDPKLELASPQEIDLAAIQPKEKGGAKQCPQCGNSDVRWATIEDGGLGDWCPHCKKSFKAMGLVKESPPLKGIGGWLILPLIGLIITIIGVPLTVYKELVPVFTGGYWQVVTSPASDFYHPLWAPTILFELLGNLTLVLFAVILLWLLVQHSRWLPKLIIAFFVLNFLFMSGDYVLVGMLPNVQSDPESWKEIFRSLVACVIWIPYFLESKRVKATFVK